MDQNKLKRPLERWSGCAACAIASGSTAQMMYFVEDAKSDIATLAAEVDARDALLREAYSALAFAFNRIHGLARARDTELANDFAKTRGRIEKLLGKDLCRLARHDDLRDHASCGQTAFSDLAANGGAASGSVTNLSGEEEKADV